MSIFGIGLGRVSSEFYIKLKQSVISVKNHLNDK